MAVDHMPENGRVNVDGSLLKHKIYTDPKFSDEESRSQNLWPRAVARKWTFTLFVGTCLLYCARMAMPICAVTMATTFHWSKIDSGLVMGGFYWGYCFTQILGGHASDKLGGEWVLFISTALWALTTCVTPLLAELGTRTVTLMIMARFLMGVLQGVFFPSLASICSQRVVEGERGFLMSTMQSGCYLGALVVGGMGSIMLDSYSWKSMFYCIGSMSTLWALLVWLCFLRGDLVPARMETSADSEWTWSRLLSLLMKPPVWAMVIAHMCNCCTSNTLLSWLPTYFKESFPHATGWAYNVIPWLVAIPSALGGSYVSNFLFKQGYTTSAVRKIMQVFAMGVSSMFVMLLCEGTFTSFTTALIFLSVAVGLTTFTSCGVSVNVQDLAPSCAGALYGFMNMLGALTGLVLVALSGYLIEVTQSWASMFSLISLVNITGLVIYLLFGDAHRVDLEY